MMKKCTADPSCGFLSKAQYLQRMNVQCRLADQIFPKDAPVLGPNSMVDGVMIPQQLWHELYSVMRLYPHGIEQKQLGEDFVSVWGKPLGGDELYKKCHVKTLHKLLVTLPDVIVVEIKPGTVGYRLRKPGEEVISLTAKHKKTEKIRLGSKNPHLRKRGDLKVCDDDDLDEEDDYDSDGDNPSILPSQPAILLPKGAEIPESVRRRTHKLLFEKYPEGMDIVAFNERYQKQYKQCINPTVRCGVDMPQLFRAMSDILKIGYGPKNLMYIKAKSFSEIKAWRYDPEAHARTALPSLKSVKARTSNDEGLPIGFKRDDSGAVQTAFGTETASLEKKKEHLVEESASDGVTVALDVDLITMQLNDLRDDENEIADYFYNALKDCGPHGIEVDFAHGLFPYKDPMRSEIQKIMTRRNLQIFLHRFPDKFQLYKKDSFIFIAVADTVTSFKDSFSQPIYGN